MWLRRAEQFSQPQFPPELPRVGPVKVLPIGARRGLWSQITLGEDTRYTAPGCQQAQIPLQGNIVTLYRIKYLVVQLYLLRQFLRLYAYSIRVSCPPFHILCSQCPKIAYHRTRYRYCEPVVIYKNYYALIFLALLMSSCSVL